MVSGQGPTDAVRQSSGPATPRPPGIFVSRPRLRAFLDGVRDTPVNLVVAPAGSGKTAAVAAWTERAAHADPPVSVAWTSGDQTETIAALVEAMRCPDHPDGPDVVVIDDVQVVAEPVRRLLLDVLSTDAGSVRLLLVGRQEPEVVPISAALAGDVRSLRVDDLRFDDAEAAELVRAHHPAAGPDDVRAVLEQADGWAAALVLGSRALAGSANGADARAALAATRQPVLDYLLHEVFETLPPELAHVLLTTSQQARVTADEAVLLSGLTDAPALLDRAAAAGLLVTSYPDEAPGGTPDWRYHPLLLDLLRRRTAPTGPDWPAVVEAHHRAVAAYVDRRDAERAVEHSRLTGDLDVQIRVLREFTAELLGRRRTDVLNRALATIPVDIRTRHPELLALQATLLRDEGRIDAAKATTDRALAAEARSLTAPLGRDSEALLAILKLWQARYGWREAESALARASRVLGCRHDAEVSAHDLAGLSPLAAAWLSLELASFQTWLGQHELAAIHVQDVVMYAQQVDLPALNRGALAQRAVLEMVSGAYQTGLATADAALAVDVHGVSPDDTTAARAHLARGWGLLMELRLDEAEAALADFDATPAGVMDPLLLAFGRLLRACVLTALGEPESARRLLDTRGIVPERLPRYLSRLDRLVRLVIAVSMADLATVEGLVRGMRALGAEADARLAEAVACGLAGDEQRAVRMLAELLPGTVEAPAGVGLSSVAARIAFLQRIGTPGSLHTARDLIPDMLSRAAPQRLLWFLSLGSLVSPAFVDLLHDDAASAEPHPFSASAVAALGQVRHRYPDVTRTRTAGSGPDEARSLLTARELEVLEQLALGGGNADLARALYVSENTVKTHLASIYRKLEVDRRVDALRVARSHGLL